MKSHTILGAAIALVLTSSSFALSAQEAPVLPCDDVANEVLAKTPKDTVKRITAFTPAKVLERISPHYPRLAAAKGAEGWVQMSYVIDIDGNVVDPVVEDFGGNEGFKSSALRAIKKWKFDPALKDGEPTEQCHQAVQFDFTMGGNIGATRSFVRMYTEAEELFDAGNYKAADALVQTLHNNKNNNRYENAWVWSLDAKLAAKLDDTEREARAIKRTLASSASHAEGKQTFKATYMAYLHQKLFNLQAELGQYGSALDTLAKIKALPDADALLAPIESGIAYVNEMIASDDNLFLTVNLKDSGEYFHSLVRNSFAFANIQGQLDTVEVRCESRREKFTVAENFVWSIPESWGQCQVLVSGDADTSFEFVETS